MEAISWKINATITNDTSDSLVETVGMAAVEVAMVAVTEEGDAEEDATKAVEVEDEVRRLKSMA